jgi:tetratricopeptide (TPR) repeat protein
MVLKRLSSQTLFVCALTVAVALVSCSDPAVRKQKAYEKGVALSESGDAKKAILEFRNAIQIDPNFTDARYQLGLCLLQLHNDQAALGELKRVEETEPTRAGLRPYLAEALVGAGKFAEGRELCVALVKESPENAALHEFLSRALLGLSQPQTGQPTQEAGAGTQDYLTEATAEAEKALALDPKLVEPHMTLAQVLILKHGAAAVPTPLGEAVEAKVDEQFEAAKKSSPDDLALLRRIAGLWSWAGNRSRAMSEVEAVLAASPDDADARVMKAEFLFDDGKVDEATAILDKLAEEKLSSPRINFLAGRIWFAKGDFEKARDEFKEVKDSAPGGYFLALCLEKLGDRQHALSQLEQVIDQTPTHEGARRALFEMYMGDANSAKASLHAEQAVKAAPQSPLGYLLRARVYGAQRDWAQAHEAVDDALQRAPGLFEALLLRTDLYMKEGKLEQCKAAIEEVIKAQPDAEVGYLARSEVHLALKEFAEAEKDARRAVELAPKDPNPRVTIARARVAQGDFDGAYAAYEEVLQMAPDNSVARFAFAGLCAARKEYDKAITLLGAIGEDDASYVQARTRIAELYDATGNPTAASAEYEKLLASHPDAADATVGMFQHLARAQDLGEMEELAKATLQRDPDSVLGHLMLSDVHSARGQWAPAAEEMNAAVKKQPNSARLWFRLGSLNANASRFKEALDALMRARELQPGFDEATLGAAKMLARTGKGEEALALCGKVLEKKPDDVSANLATADVKAALGKDPEAESAYRSLIASRPTYLLPYLHLVALYEKGQDTAKAREVFDAAIAAAPKVPELRVEYGRFWERAKDLQRAREQYTRALELSPDNSQVQDMLARVSAGTGDYTDAEKRLRARVAQTPDDLSARLNLALVLEKEGKTEEATKSLFDFVTASKSPEATGMEMSRVFASTGQYDRIERLAQSLLEADPTKWMAHYALGIARAGQGDPEGALQHFSEAAKLNEKTPLPKHAEGLMYARLNRPDEALAAFDAARQIDNHFLAAYTDAALVCLRKKDFGAAEDLCRKAMEADPKDGKPVALLAAAYAQSDQVQKALRTVYDLLERDPQQAVAASTVADVLGAGKHYDDAITLCQRCLAVAPETPVLLMRLATLYEQAGKRDLAVAEYRRLVALAPDAPMAHNNLAWVLSEQGNLDEALPHAQRARELAPDNPAVLDTLGWIHLKKGDMENAIPLLETSAKGAPKVPSVLYHLGKAYCQAGRAEDARPLLTQALELNANFPEAEDARKTLDSMAAGPK